MPTGGPGSSSADVCSAKLARRAKAGSGSGLRSFRLAVRILYTLLFAALLAPSCGRPMGKDVGTDVTAPDGRLGTDGGAGPEDVGEGGGEDGGVDGGSGPDGGVARDPWAFGPQLGARRTAQGLEVRVRAPSATRLELCLFAAATGEVERLRVPFDREADRFRVIVSHEALAAAGLSDPLFYGLRAFGPNWPYVEGWAPGSELGFESDVDGEGNRMNPNKVLFDPYALELSHDPTTTWDMYRSGPDHRAKDSARFVPKGVVLDVEPAQGPGPERPLKDEVISEAQVRGLTKNDPSLPEALRGTYAGAALKAQYFKDLGVTALELMPAQETQNDQNDLSPESAGDNYWGYSTLGFFAPDRRYAVDRDPGGPTRELRAMVAAFHAVGIKVYLDVVYNHTGEGGGRGAVASLLSFRGLGNRQYYQLADDPAGYVSSNGVGPNVNTKDPLSADLVVDSLRYWHEIIGVDGFRFDLAPVVANGCERGCYRFEKDGILARIGRDLPARPRTGGPGVDLIAEPWGAVGGTYQIGQFPAPWAEWNDHFRDTIRRDLNRLGVDTVPLREIRERWRGSPDLFADRDRSPAASINYVVSHDGLTLHDLFSYAARDNGQRWPCGPSDGGNGGEPSWDHRGDPLLQRRAARTAWAFAALSAGVPMMLAGDEILRSQGGNNNAYNIDSSCTWIDWSSGAAVEPFRRFISRLHAFRSEHPALRPAGFWGDPAARWLRDDGGAADGAYLDAGDRHFLALLLDGRALGDPSPALYLAYNGWSGSVVARLPDAPAGTGWHLAGDTSVAAEAWDNWHPGGALRPIATSTYAVEARTMAVFVAQ